MFRKFSADIVFPVSSPPIPDGIVVTDEDGTILEIASLDSPLKSPLSGERGSTDVQHYTGIIVPGFINAHCHLELSHLKGVIPQKTGLDEFIMGIESLRLSGEEEIIRAAEKADVEMHNEGIVAVGDISNKSHSFGTKAKSKIYYHTFIELLGFHPSRVEYVFEKGIQLKEELRKEFMETTSPLKSSLLKERGSTKVRNFQSISPVKSSLTMHAPYSASVPLLEKIRIEAEKNNSALTMHNQENADENLLFINKSGKILKRLEALGIDASFFEPTGKSSLLSVLPHLPAKNKIQLVHNIHTTRAEIDEALNYNPNLYWCFCPNANLYIENRLPDIKMYSDKKLKITLGTDSLASNWQLSMLEEIKIIQKNFSAISFEDLLKWATLNGADFLGIADQFGSIEKDKRPGLIHISGLNNQNLQLTSQAKAQRLI